MDKKKVVCKMCHCLKRVGVKVLMLSGSFSSYQQTTEIKLCSLRYAQWFCYDGDTKHATYLY